MCKKEVFISIMIGALLLSGCSTKANQAQNADNSAAVSSSVTEIDTSDMFSNRDKEVGYEESESVTVSLADDGSSCESDAVSITENTVTIKDEGTYVLSGALSDGMVIVDAEDTDKIQLVLKDVSISNAQSAALYVRAADKVFVTTASGTENTLENCGGYTAIDDNNIDAAVFSKSDLTFNGEGTLTITAQEGHGIVSKDDLALTSGTYVVTSASHGISGKDSVRIANGSYTITSGKDGIHAENTDDSSKGFVYLAGGTFDIASQQDGISASAWLQADDGTYTILTGAGSASVQNGGEEMPMEPASQKETDTTSIKGMKASVQLVLKGGTYTVDAEDDAFHSNGNLAVSGGTYTLSSGDDGIHADSNVTISGGKTYLSGPVNSGNGTLDYNGSAVVTGGIFAASGSSGMAQNFDSSSTQGVMMMNVGEQEEGSELALLDSSGTKLISWTAEKAYSSMIVSCPAIKEGETYTIKAGTTEQSITMDSLVYGSDSQAGGNPRNGESGKGDRKEGGMKGGQGEGQAPENMEKPQGNTPPDVPEDNENTN